MVDMDRLAAQEYTPDVIVAMSESIAGMQNSAFARPLDRRARSILRSVHVQERWEFRS